MLSIQNSTSPLDKATLFIEGTDFDIALPITMDGDKATVNVPILENMLKPGTYGMRLEMVLGGVVYTPFKDSLDFNAPVSIQVESAKQIVSEAAPSISVKAAKVVPVVEKLIDPIVDTKFSPQFADLLATLVKQKS